MPDDERDSIIELVKSEAQGKGITRFISTHPDNDHILGLLDLDAKMNIVNFYCVANGATKPEPTEDFKKYCELRDGQHAFHIQKGSKRKWLNESDAARSGAGLEILWPELSNSHFKSALAEAEEGGSPNNISCIVQYKVLDGVKVLWMGDLETDFMESIEGSLELPSVDVLFAPHHGRDSGKVPASWLDDLKPKVVVIGEAPSEELSYYEGYNTITQNSAGHIALDCAVGEVDVYVSEEEYSVSFLRDARKGDGPYGKYLGTLDV